MLTKTRRLNRIATKCRLHLSQSCLSLFKLPSLLLRQSCALPFYLMVRTPVETPILVLLMIAIPTLALGGVVPSSAAAPPTQANYFEAPYRRDPYARGLTLQPAASGSTAGTTTHPSYYPDLYVRESHTHAPQYPGYYAQSSALGLWSQSRPPRGSGKSSYPDALAVFRCAVHLAFSP